MRSSLRVGMVARAMAVGGFVLFLVLPGAQAKSQQSIDSDAARILQSMSSYLAHLPAFSADVDVDTEVVDRSGQKLQFSSSGSVILKRPDKLYGTRKGGFADAEFYFDGKTVTMYGKNKNVYAQVESAGTIDDAIEAVRERGLDMAGADLLFANPYAGLLTDVTSGHYYGTDVVNGIKCDHLAFRAAQVDWQIWVQTGDKRLPMKYIITSKWITGAPEYDVRLRNWNVNPAIDSKRFTFTPPPGSKKVEAIVPNALGEMSWEGRR